jgi:SET domain-containing protein
MLLIKTVLRESPAHGCGLFADEDLKSGQKVWEFNSLFDRLYLASDAEKLDPRIQEFLAHYASKNVAFYFLSVDNARFINHGEPNLGGDVIKGLFAQKDIKKGEELFIDYGLNASFTSFKKSVNG